MPTADLLVHEGLKVLSQVAQRIARRLGHRVPVEDLIAIGRPALVEIVRAYDPGRASFGPYAALKLKWAIFDGLRRETRWRSELARAAALAASERYAEAPPAEAAPPADDPQACQRQLAELLAGHAAAMALGLVAGRVHPDGSVADGGESPEERAARAELAEVVRREVGALPERERALIERHYYGGERFDRIARDLGISKSRASRLHAQAIDALSRTLRDGDR